MAKTYGQFCGLARALDHVGDRWTLLVVRELLLGDATYGDLRAALDGIPTNLLADRLRILEGDGLVTRDTSHPDRRRVTYRLTPLGRGLEPAILALISWGSHWMLPGQGDDRFDPRWGALALRALLGERDPPVRGTLELRTDGPPLQVVSTGGGPLRVGPRVGDGPRVGAPASPDAVVRGDTVLLLGLVSGRLSLSAALRRGMSIEGDRALVRALLLPRPPGP